MRFRFKPSDETVEAGFRRIASETLDDALGLLRDRDLPTAQIVHRVRRHCKAMRGLLRIVRPVFPAYQAENVIFRDVAASLSAARDSVVLVEALDGLIAEAETSRRNHPALEPGAIDFPNLFRAMLRALAHLRRLIHDACLLQPR